MLVPVLALCAVGAIVWYLHRRRCAPPRLYHQHTREHAALLRDVPQLLSEFVPTPWLALHLLQTLVSNAWRSPPSLSFVRETIHGEDGELLHLDWARCTSPLQEEHSHVTLREALAGQHPESSLAQEDSPIVLVLHGISGGSHEVNIQWFVKVMARDGFRVCVVNRRGCAPGAPPLRRGKFYLYGDTCDFACVVRHVVRKYLSRPSGRAPPLLAAGFSAGSNVLVRYLGECGDSCPIDAAVSVCNGFDLARVATSLKQSTLGRLGLDAYMARVMRQVSYERHASARRCAVENKELDRTEMLKIQSFIDYDEQYTRRVHGYDSVHDMYADNSCIEHLRHVRVPLLLLG
ncbi:MAG: hypothetical protein MHM6MM_008897, partial [Cercozoa sp. M6MM]